MATGEKLKAGWNDERICPCRGCTTSRNQVVDYFVRELEEILKNPLIALGTELILPIKIQKLIDKTKGSN